MDMTWLAGGSMEIQHARLASVDAVVGWVNEHLPRVLAIDAPCKRNAGRSRTAEVRERYGFTADNFQNCRVCEALLKQRNIQTYSTPYDDAAGWIRTGWQIYDRLTEDHGYEIWDKPGSVNLGDSETRVLVEVYPHAVFVVGIGARPANKKSFAGQLERIAWLLEVAEVAGLTPKGDVWPDPTILSKCRDCFAALSWGSILEHGAALPPLPSHDTLDSLAGLLTAYFCMNGTAWAVGEADEGVIVLPGRLEGQYLSFAEDRMH